MSDELEKRAYVHILLCLDLAPNSVFADSVMELYKHPI
jgi:hypothetical protein